MILTGTCPECDKECEVEITDMSFDWERGSERGTHHHDETISGCCGADMDASEQIREAQGEAAIAAYEAMIEDTAESEEFYNKL